MNVVFPCCTNGEAFHGQHRARNHLIQFTHATKKAAEETAAAVFVIALLMVEDDGKKNERPRQRLD